MRTKLLISEGPAYAIAQAPPQSRASLLVVDMSPVENSASGNWKSLCYQESVIFGLVQKVTFVYCFKIAVLSKADLKAILGSYQPLRGENCIGEEEDSVISLALLNSHYQDYFFDELKFVTQQKCIYCIFPGLLQVVHLCL